MDFPKGQYGIIYCDPPWRFYNFSQKGEEKNPAAHYDCMDIDALKAMRDKGLRVGVF